MVQFKIICKLTSISTYCNSYIALVVISGCIFLITLSFFFKVEVLSEEASFHIRDFHSTLSYQILVSTLSMWHQPEMCNGQTFYFFCNVLFWYFPYWSSSWTSVYRPKPSVCIPICSSDRTNINYQSKIVEQLGKYNIIFLIVLAALSCILRQQNRTDCVVSVLEQHSVTDCVQTCNIRWS